MELTRENVLNTLGKIIEPVNTKSRIKTLIAIQPRANGSVSDIPSCVSV
jgi:hypothetical protein